MPRSRLANTVLAASVTLLPFLTSQPVHGAGFDRGSPSVRQDAVLSGVYSATRQMVREGITPVSVFDLDATLFDAGARHKAIMAEFARANRRKYPRMAGQVDHWVSDRLPYDIKERFADLGLRTPEEVKRAREFWDARFFSNEYLRHDVPIAGAIDYVNSLYDAGSAIVYLTGRNDQTMRPGSEETLANAGFPIDGKRAVLLMSPRRGIRDHEFKGSVEVRDRIQSMGTVVGIFDNEPGNCNELQKSFPDSFTVFLDTNHTPKAPQVDTGIPWISNFRWSWQEALQANRRGRLPISAPSTAGR